MLDGDLDLTNDYDIARHAEFYPGTFGRHTVVNIDGKEYSFHGLGTGILALPGFWAAGLTGVRISFLAVETPLLSPPPGRYRVDVSDLPESGDSRTTLSLIIGGGEHAIWTLPLADGNRAPVISLPVPVESIRIAVSGPLSKGTSVRIRPLSRHAIPVGAGGFRALYAMRSREALLFVFDAPQAERGGFWVATDRPVSVSRSQLDGESACAALQFEAGSHPVDLQLTQGDSRRSLSLVPHQVGYGDLPGGLAAMVISASGPLPRTPAVFVTAVPQPASR